jgi:hypothetical protein
MIVGYDHVQVAIPSGAEAVARDYYGSAVGRSIRAIFCLVGGGEDAD